MARLEYFRDLDRFARDYGVGAGEKAVLMAQFPLRKLHWHAHYGSPGIQRVAASLSNRMTYLVRHHVTKNGRTAEIVVSMASADFDSYEEMFWGGAYAVPFDLSSVKSVVDLGGNIGMASLWLCVNCPNVTDLLVVEANPFLIPKIERTLADQAKRIRVQIEHLCISNDPAPTVTFHVATNHRMSLKDGSLYSGEVTPVTVPNKRLSTLLDERGIEEADFLKMDIEGSEFDVIEDNDVLRRFRFLGAEIHGERLEKRQSFVKRITDLGFRVADGFEHSADFPSEQLYAVRVD